MGFYLRKSISVGPLRFNLSKSGVGVSAGIKGLRFGTGPRGNYVHMGSNGLYYRATIPATSSSPTRPQPIKHFTPTIPTESHGPMVEIESSDASQITDSSSKELLNELNLKRTKSKLWPIVAFAFTVIFFICVFNSWASWILLSTVIIGLIATYIAFNHDTLAKTVVLFYDFDAEMEEAYGRLHGAAAKIAGCAVAWHIEAQGNVHDRKYHAGASSLLQRKITSIRKEEPPYVKCNIETIAVDVGRQTLHFFPDRVLIYDSNGVGAVGYQELSVSVSSTRFIETAAPPRDAKVVGHTWKYVNKSGGPDRRFKDNRELPICLYDEIALSSQTGLDELLQISRCDIAGAFAEAISVLAGKIPKEKIVTAFAA